MLSVVVLICSLSTPPGDCDVSHALQTLSVGEEHSFMACSLRGEAMLARSALRPVRESEYAKIQCAPR